jgi:menaquinone-dependent protoporphyrinogen IX oxidase
MKETAVMRALVVVESWFGNTAEIAEAIADGLREAGADV